MTPDEAAGFCEDDEDPSAVFAAYDAGPHGITAQPGYDAAAQVRWCRDYINARYGGTTAIGSWLKAMYGTTGAAQ